VYRSANRTRSQTLFTIFAFILACSLVAGVVGSIVIDLFFTTTDTGPVDLAQDDQVVESALRSTAEAEGADASDLAVLANFLANTGQLPEAIGYYEEALRLEPENATIRLDFARSLAAGGYYQDAEFQFLRVIELDPQNPQAYFYLGELYMNWSPPRTDEAIREFRMTIETGPGTFVAERAAERLEALGETAPQASPIAAPLEGD
jgi:tetratricopeptide (TPR) repeat protein